MPCRSRTRMPTRRPRNAATVEKTQGNLDTIRTGRANPAILDRLMVEYYGAETPLKTIAGVSTPDAQTLQIQPFDMGALPDIERAIMESDVGITPNNDGKVIRLTIPQLTKERRKDLAKQVSKLGEEGKVAIRNVRRDALKQTKKLEIPEDALTALQKKCCLPGCTPASPTGSRANGSPSSGTARRTTTCCCSSATSARATSARAAGSTSSRRSRSSTRSS